MPEPSSHSHSESVLARAGAIRARSEELLLHARALRGRADQVRCEMAVLRGRMGAALEAPPAERGESGDV